jgi:hypothetical protein
MNYSRQSVTSRPRIRYDPSLLYNGQYVLPFYTRLFEILETCKILQTSPVNSVEATAPLDRTEAGKKVAS